jgi:hypothetical protein
MRLILYFVCLSASASEPPGIPDDAVRLALEHVIAQRGPDLVACVDVRDRLSPERFLASIRVPGHTAVALSDCVSSPDGIKTASGRPAFNILLENWARKPDAKLHVTVSWYQSSSEGGSEALLLILERGGWRIAESLGKWAV